MHDPHKDALEQLHSALSDHLAKRLGKKPEENGGEHDGKSPHMVEVSITKAEPVGHGEPDGDEGEADGEDPEKEHSPGVAHALDMLKMLRKR